MASDPRLRLANNVELGENGDHRPPQSINPTTNSKKISWTFCQGCDTENIQLIWVRLIHFVGQSLSNILGIRSIPSIRLSECKASDLRRCDSNYRYC